MDVQMKLTLFFLSSIIFSCYPTTAARVLVVPHQHYSSIYALSQMAMALTEDGHEVWMLTLYENHNVLPKNGAIKPLYFSVSKEAQSEPQMEELMRLKPTGEGLIEEMAKTGIQSFGLFCDNIMQNEDLMKAIENKHFNLAIINYLEEFVCLYMVAYKFNIPYITFTSDKVASWHAGVTGLPSIEPELRNSLTNHMSFWQRLQNMHAWLSLERNQFSKAFSELHMEKYAPHRPQVSFHELVRRSEMFLINYEVMCLDYPRVSAPNYQFLGVTSAKSGQPLSKDLKNFINGAHHGIVVLSLGSHRSCQMAWKILREKMFLALSKLPQRAIVQYNFEETGKVPSNIKLMEWIPQNDLLAHPKTRLFITHGGANGQNEAIYHGVPSLIIPFFFDQFYAGARAEAHGYGMYVRDKEVVTSEELFQMMSEITSNESYIFNTKRCSRIIKSMPSAKTKFVFWVNHILNFGGAHLKPPSLEMPLYQILMLDIIAFYTSLIVGGLYSLAFGLFICIHFSRIIL